MTSITKLSKAIMGALSAKAGAAIWKSIDPKTKWHLVKANTAIISAALARNITRNPTKTALVATAILAGVVIGTILLLRRK